MADDIERIKILIENDPHILTHYPDYFKENEEINAICDGEDPELKLYIERAVQIIQNILPRTSDVEGVKKYEDWLNIPLEKTAGLTLDQRKDQIVAQLNETLPYTEITLQKMLANIAGWGNFHYERHGAFVDVTLEPEAADSLGIVMDMLRRVLPMNLHFRLNGEVIDETQAYVYGIGTLVQEDMIQEVDYTEKIAHVYTGGSSLQQRVILTYPYMKIKKVEPINIGVGDRIRVIATTPVMDS